MDSFDAEGTLRDIRHKLQEKSYVWVNGKEYRHLLLFFGASEKSLLDVEQGIIHSQVEKDKVPMDFRQVAFHREIIGLEGTTWKSNTHAVTQISQKEITSKKGAKIQQKRSGTRTWNLPPTDYATSDVSSALTKLNAFLTPTEHHPQPNINQDSPLTIIDQILIRVNKLRLEDICEPTPEGIHQDGTEISSVTLIHRHNIIGGGETRIWTLDQPFGNYDSPEFGVFCPDSQLEISPGFQWENCLLNRPLLHPWETIIFNDREIKHEVRPFIPGNYGLSYRDVIVSFVRKPLLDGSDKIKLVDGSLMNIDDLAE